MHDKFRIETPALLVDLDAVEENIVAMQRFASAAGLRLRPHTKTSKSPEIAKMQIEAGAVGICCAKLSEAVTMLEGGISDILITTPVVGRSKIARLISLANRSSICVVVDNQANANELSEAAQANGVALGVYIELDVGQRRTGVTAPAALADLAMLIRQLPNLSLKGMQAYNGSIQFIQPAAERREAAARVAAAVKAAKTAVEDRHILLPVVSGGGTGSVVFDVEFAQFNELQPGSYIYMDDQYGCLEWTQTGPHFRPAISVLATVISVPAPDRVVLDSGWKSLSVDAGVPTVIGDSQARFDFAGDEHGIITCDGSRRRPELGDKIELRPSHCDTTVNLYDKAFAVRRGRILREIAISGRGCTQ